MYCPNRWLIIGKLGILDTWAVGKTRTSLATARAVSKSLKDTSARFGAGPNYNLDPGDFLVLGEYNPVADEEDGIAFIECYISFGEDKIAWMNDNWLKFKHEVADMLCHEKIHSRQHRTRRFRVSRNTKKSVTEKEYLSEPDEIESYAHNIASELYDHYGYDDARLKEWEQLILPRPPNSPSIHLWAYGREFGNDLEFMDRLLNKVHIFMDEIHRQYKTLYWQ